jgi:hypothetical protein
MHLHQVQLLNLAVCNTAAAAAAAAAKGAKVKHLVTAIRAARPAMRSCRLCGRLPCAVEALRSRQQLLSLLLLPQRCLNIRCAAAAAAAGAAAHLQVVQ